MKVVIGIDGSKYSEWVGRIPLHSALRVTAIHSIDLNSARPSALTMSGSVSLKLVQQPTCSFQHGTSTLPCFGIQPIKILYRTPCVTR